jgi:hypothetical protein
LIEKVSLNDESESLGFRRSAVKDSFIITSAPPAVSHRTVLNPPSDAMLLCRFICFLGVNMYYEYLSITCNFKFFPRKEVGNIVECDLAPIY